MTLYLIGPVTSCGVVCESIVKEFVANVVFPIAKLQLNVTTKKTNIICLNDIMLLIVPNYSYTPHHDMDAKGFEAIAVLGGAAPDSIPLSKLFFDSDILICGPESPPGLGHGP